LLFGNLRPRVTTTPLPHTTDAYGQLTGRDFNPLDLLLLLRTVDFFLVTFWLRRNWRFLGGQENEALQKLSFCVHKISLQMRR
jgi:hypothetical protein